MIDFRRLSRKELADNGLSFKTAAEADLFADIITEELEERVGEAITKAVGEEKSREFELCTTQEEEAEWLRKACPGYPEIIIEKEKELNREIMEYRDRIPGVIGNAPTELKNMTIEEMDLSLRSLNCLKRAGLHTVGDLLEYGDLSNMRSLSQSCIEEIQNRLREINSRKEEKPKD